MRRLSLVVLATAFLMPAGASGEDRLSKAWTTNKHQNKVFYCTSNVMPAGSELRMRVEEAGKADIFIYNFNDTGASPQVHRFTGVSAGQVLKFKLPFKMRVGIGIGSPAQASCDGVEDKTTHHTLKYDFNTLGHFTLDTKVIAESF